MRAIHREKVIHSLYAGVLHQQEWQSALENFRCLTNSEQAALVTWNRQTDETLIAEICRPDERLVEDYEGHYAGIDPTKKIIVDYPIGRWYLDRRDMGVQAMRQSEFYQDFMRSHGLSSILCTTVMQEGPVLFCLSFQAGLGRPGFDGKESAILDPIFPHLQRAVMLRWQFQELSRQALLSTFVLNRFHTPIMVVDCGSKVIMSNDATQSWLERACSHPTGKANVADVIATIAKKICDPGNVIPIAAMKCSTGRKGETSYLLGLPLQPDHPIAQHWSKRVGVIIVQQSIRKMMPWAEIFRDLFDLSRAEVRLLECLAEQDSLYKAAFELGISRETARSQLKAIFQKTGVNKQAALLRLIVQLSQMH